MADNINFKHYWEQQTVETPSASAFIKKAKSYKKKARFRLFAANITLIATSILIGFIWYYYQPEFLTTKIGIITCILDMLIFLVFHNTLVPLLFKRDYLLNVKDELRQLKRLKEKQYFQQTTLLSIYYIVLYIGLGLYMYEYATRMTVFWAVFSYGIMLVWICINAFYFRPKIVKKHQRQLNELIAQLDKIEDQLYEK